MTSFLEKLRRLTVYVLILVVLGLGTFLYFERKNHVKSLTKLHNEIAAKTKTVEVTSRLFEKRAAALDDIEAVLKTFKENQERDRDTIADLIKLIKKRDEELLSANRLVVKWKNAYEGEANAEQESIPANPQKPEGKKREKVSFSEDFGYIDVSGFTLTDPAQAWVKVRQKRPLILTVSMAQAKDGHWSTYVSSSEKDIDVDVRMAAVNPYAFSEKWYEKFSVDLGMTVDNNGLFPHIGLSYPLFGPVNVSTGLQTDTLDQELGWYATLQYSWKPFSRR